MKHIKLFEEYQPIDLESLKKIGQEKSNKIIDKLKISFDLKEWNSPEVKEKRKKLANDALNTYERITDIMNSTIEDEKKAYRIQRILKGTILLTGISAIISLFFGSDISFSLKSPFIHGLAGGTWVTITACLIVLKVIHYVLSSGEAIKSTIKSIWDGVLSLFKNKNLNESKYLNFENIEYLLD